MSQPGMEKRRQQPRLLVVDDNEPGRTALSRLLGEAGYDVETATDAQEALQLSQMVRWDGVVLDIDLPGGNGVELYVRILSHSGNRRLPVLFLTGQPNPMLGLSLHYAPWARLVLKPCDPLQLLATLEDCLRKGGPAVPTSGN